MKNKKTAVGMIMLLTILLIILVLSKGDLSKIDNIEEFGNRLGSITLVPTLAAVTLAFITKNIFFSLLNGFAFGALILALSKSKGFVPIILTFFKELYQNGKEVILDVENTKILLLCILIGGAIELIGSSGGFKALAERLTKRTNTPRKAGLVATLLGCIIFFDDYANALIVGPIMQPIVDKVKISREKLAYIIDSTSASITGIALISSWIAVEIASIDEGLLIAKSQLSGFGVFLESIPYCFYCIFCVSFVFLNCLLERDFGKMLKAEKKTRNTQVIYEHSKIMSEKNIDEDKSGKKIFVGVGGVVILSLIAIISFYLSGKKMAISLGKLPLDEINIHNIVAIISYADTANLISLAAVIASIFALFFGTLFKLYTPKDGIKSWIKGVKEIIPTILLLITAWCLAETINRLGATYYAIEIISANVPAILVPILIFIVCCLISFTSGSFGCMFVVMPLAIPLAYKIMTPVISDNNYLYLCVGSVIAGSIFGDHCSPVTDCTILSATSSGCDVMEHCHSQLLYSFICFAISIVCGIVLTYLGLNVFISLLIGIIMQGIILLIFGEKLT